MAPSERDHRVFQRGSLSFPHTGYRRSRSRSAKRLHHGSDTRSIFPDGRQVLAHTFWIEASRRTEGVLRFLEQSFLVFGVGARFLGFGDGSRHLVEQCHSQQIVRSGSNAVGGVRGPYRFSQYIHRAYQILWLLQQESCSGVQRRGRLLPALPVTVVGDELQVEKRFLRTVSVRHQLLGSGEGLNHLTVRGLPNKT